MARSRDHWEQIYADKLETTVSWYQPEAARSLKLIDSISSDAGQSVIDVGGGASTLIDGLLDRGFFDLTVLDISDAALCRSRARLGINATRVEWLRADVTQWSPARTWDIWHDRAVFHFLTETAQQDAYIAALSAATRPGATVIIATFAPDGPERCSGLPVQRYEPESLARRLGDNFPLLAQAAEVHRTPWGTEQRFSYSMLRRTQ